MIRGRKTGIVLAGVLGLALFVCSSCVYIHSKHVATAGQGASTPQSASAPADSSVAAATAAGSATTLSART